MKPPKDKRPFLPVKYDVIFRLFFADERNEEELIGFLKSVLRLPEDEYESIEIATRICCRITPGTNTPLLT
jgi:hypothetical protein